MPGGLVVKVSPVKGQAAALADPPTAPGRRRIGSVEVLAVLLVLVVFRNPLGELISGALLQTCTTVFVSVLVQAVPILVFGVVLSAVIAVYVPRSFWAKALPRHPALAVPAASAAGVVLPGCESGSVPMAGSLIRRGVTPAAALAFLLAAPVINPIVLTAPRLPFRPSRAGGRPRGGEPDRVALAVRAVLLSICSEADAFVAASLSQFSLTSRLVFWWWGRWST
jgi:uncharacterized protein